MAGLVRYPAANAFATFSDAADSVYGTGMSGNQTLDGTTTILGMVPSSNVYTMTEDLYFNNLTINAGVRLSPAGYRIFVKNILTFSGNNATIGFTTGFSTSGSIMQGGTSLSSVTHSLGGNGRNTSTNTDVPAVAPTASLGGTAYFRIGPQAMTGYSLTASGGPVFLRGGAAGTGQVGGGVVLLAARYIAGPASGSTAYIQAPATSPGGGGVVIIVSTAPELPPTVATNVTGYAAGTVNYIQLV